ncbi:MAG: c-type cytochrome [Acidobacteriota bacterium]
MKLGWQMVTLMAAAVISLGMTPPNQDPVSRLTADDLARGKQMFVGQCALCHGIGATGGRGPALNQPDLPRAADNSALFQIIKNGIPETEMPDAWQMTDREIWQVAGYVRSLGGTAVVKLPGDTSRGKAIYDSKGACAACHIVSGRGGSLGPKLTDIGARRSAAYLREALTDPGASVPDGFLVVSIVTRDGHKVRGMRANEDSFTIQLRDAAGVFHSFRKLDLAELKKEFGSSMMPAYRDALSASELDDLVAYLSGLRGGK